MRSNFDGFYGITEDTVGEVFTSNETVFIFDTNILLTLYRCEEETRNQFFAIWRKIKDQCWFPHHVCLEYQRNRLNVVKGSRDSLTAVQKKIDNAITSLRKDLSTDEFNKTISRYSNLRGELDIFLEKVTNLANEFESNSINIRNNKIDFFSSHDVIRDQIDELTEGHIGPEPESQDIINQINHLGKTRYKYNIGPGFEDAKDKKNVFYSYKNINYDGEYGDYYVWHQMLDYVTSNQNKNVVYVTNDAKSDFFFKIDGKVRGPNESLITEMKSRGAQKFLLQNINTFLHHANAHLNARIDDTTISELTNASPLNKGSVDVLKLLTRQIIRKNIHELSRGSISKSHCEDLEKTYSKNLEILDSSLKQLCNLDLTSTTNLNEVELAQLEEQRQKLLSKIEFSKMLLKNIDASLNDNWINNSLNIDDIENSNEDS
ncbi:PIN-like domain-containing protein [Klebsiella grimontii]|uniref:PIN-like domain-containing protein n=1 Tax=Klebsiella grimontii TaxID=2058152 RepID=UPI0035CCA359